MRIVERSQYSEASESISSAETAYFTTDKSRERDRPACEPMVYGLGEQDVLPAMGGASPLRARTYWRGDIRTGTYWRGDVRRHRQPRPARLDLLQGIAGSRFKARAGYATGPEKSCDRFVPDLSPCSSMTVLEPAEDCRSLQAADMYMQRRSLAEGE